MHRMTGWFWIPETAVAHFYHLNWSEIQTGHLSVVNKQNKILFVFVYLGGLPGNERFFKHTRP